MKTLALQSLVTLLLLGFSVVALLTARTIGSSNPLQRGLWQATGLVLTVYSVDKLIQGVWGVVAFFAGAGAAVYDDYLRAAPVFNHSRTVLLFVLYAALLGVSLRGRLSPRGERVVLAGSAVALTLGGLAGHFEGSLQAGRHYSTTAVIDAGGFAGLAIVLMVLLLRNSADRLLWFALACQGFRSIIGVLFLAAMSWADTPNSWTPPFWLLEFSRMLFAIGMVLLGVARLRAARRRVPVPGLLPDDRSARMITA